MPPFDFERDYFLPKPSRDLTSVVHRMLEYSECSALMRALLLELEVPEQTLGGVWQLQAGSKLVLPPGDVLDRAQRS